MAGPGLAEINAFVAIAERRSFAKAALCLGVSVSTLSENLRRLEDRLGVRLIERSTRSVAASEAGERLLARLRPLLDDYEEAFEAISEFRNKPSGRLRITVGAPGAHTVMAPIVARFLTRHPEIGAKTVWAPGAATVIRNRPLGLLRNSEIDSNASS